MSTTPNARTLDSLRKEGYIAEVVEKRLPRGFTTKDLFGCIDVLAVKPGAPVLGVQATTRTNQSARYWKSIAIPALRTWLQAGCAFAIYGWAKVGAAGTRKLWQPAIRYVTIQDIDRDSSNTAVSNSPDKEPEDGSETTGTPEGL